MIYQRLPAALPLFVLFLCVLLGFALLARRRAASKGRFFSAGGTVPWFINGFAFAGDYFGVLFLGICGTVAFAGYDGFFRALGLLAGWMAVLFLLAGPLQRQRAAGFGGALRQRFGTPAVRRAATLATVVVCIVYLIPALAAGGMLLHALLGVSPAFGALIAGALALFIVAISGMVVTTGVQCCVGVLLVVCCAVLAPLALHRGFVATPPGAAPVKLSSAAFRQQLAAGDTVLPETAGWAGRHFARVRHADGTITTWQYVGMQRLQLAWPAATFTRCQTLTETPGGPLINGARPSPKNTLRAEGGILLPPNLRDPSHPYTATGPLSLGNFFDVLLNSDVALPRSQSIREANGNVTHVFIPVAVSGQDILLPGLSEESVGGPASGTRAKLDVISLMLALLCGAAVLPDIFGRYQTARDAGSARGAAALGVVVIAVLCVGALLLGLAAMTSGALDPTAPLLALPLLAGTFGGIAFVLVALLLLAGVIGTAAGLLLAVAACGAAGEAGGTADGRGVPARRGRSVMAVIAVGIVAIVLAVVFHPVSVFFLIAAAFSLAGATMLPPLIGVLFCNLATDAGVAAAIVVGLVASLVWLFLSPAAFVHLYARSAGASPLPFDQPALVCIPLAVLTLFVVSLATRRAR